MKEKVLLLGNGINDAAHSYKWKNLINDLIHFVGITDILLEDNKPFPLLYEEIYLRNLKAKKLTNLI